MRYPKIYFSLIFLLAASLCQAAPAAGKVRSALGEVSRQKKNQSSWSPLRVGSKVYQSDKVKTGQESELVLGLPDGSIITIEEQSEIALAELFEENGAYKTNIDIKSGRVSFSAQKQEKKTASFSFKTGTAVAAIRGTEGVISSSPFFAGLKNGKLEVQDSKTKKNVQIGAGQTTIVGDSLVVLELESSGDPNFAKRLTEILKDTTQNFNELVNKLKSADQTFQEELKEAKNKINCSLESLPDTTNDASVIAKGKCSTGITATLHGEEISFKNDGSFEMEIQLDSAGSGLKKFKMQCKTDSLNVDCGTFETYYLPSSEIPAAEFKLNTSTTLKVCKNGIQIQGSYRTSDSAATLYVTVGNYKSGNLMILADNQVHSFSEKISPTDKNGLWNITEASVEFTSKDLTEKKKINLQIDKTCKEVNTIVPTVHFDSYDSLRCVASLLTKNISGDIAILTQSIDGSTHSENAIQKDKKIDLKLNAGIHDYEFTIQDQAQNKNSVKKTLGCYPAKRFSIQIDGQEKESLRIPPPPKGMADVIQKNLHFKIKLQENDPTFLYKVIVKKNGKTILQEKLDQIQSLDYILPVEINRNALNQFEIEVLHKNGLTVKAKKIYEVR